MDLQSLKEQVVLANKELPKQNLVKYSWGNVSAISRELGLIVIKPVGLPYDDLTIENVSVVSLKGEIIEGPFDPSVDLPIHQAIYQGFSNVQAIVHTHSRMATAFAQSNLEIPCLGTTHADYFYGTIPCVSPLTNEAIQGDYEWNTGVAITDYFLEYNVDPLEMQAVLSPFHGPFTWGDDVWDAVHKSVVLEEIATMAFYMKTLGKDLVPIPESLLNRHFKRKHGPSAYFNMDDYGSGIVTR